ncbi:MAG: hypothetical protein ABI239_09225 [Aquihabitans sp.]
MNTEVVRVTAAGMPRTTFEQAVTYLADVLRECQLILVDGVDSPHTSQLDVVALAQVLIPDLEEVRDLFREADVTSAEERVTMDFALHASKAATMVHLQMHLVQLRFVEVEGGILVASDPEVIDLLRWIWDEASEQLHGRPPRPYHHA